MGLSGHARWKEELVITDEKGREFCFYCGWGVEPPVVYLPSATEWRSRTPGWLHDRRDEVIGVMVSLGHLVRDEPSRH